MTWAPCAYRFTSLGSLRSRVRHGWRRLRQGCRIKMLKMVRPGLGSARQDQHSELRRLENVVQREVAPATFHLADERPVQAG